MGVPVADQTRDPGASHTHRQMRNINALGSGPQPRPHTHIQQPLNPTISKELNITVNRQSQCKKGLRKRANIKIATLNMNGAHTNSESSSSFEKWAEINAVMKRERIAILALQETHLDDQQLSGVNRLFGKRLAIYNSPDPSNPRATAGVAFALNKDLISSQNLKIMELVKGRAVALKTTWNNQEETMLINVYAPNRRSEHGPFWESIEAARQRHHLRKPDFVLGDFNLTEDAIDRSPPKGDNENATNALRDLRLALDIQDQWRHLHPKMREFTYRSTINGKQIKSRLDRIYVATNKARYTYEWSIGPTSVPTDHWLVAVRYAPKGAPHIGRGRWTWPLKSLNNKKLMEKIEKKGIALQQAIHALPHSPAHRDQEQNIQTLWKTFKSEIAEIAKDTAKKSHYKRLTTLRNLQRDRKAILESQDFENNEQLRWQEALIANRIEYLERVNSHNNRAKLKAKIAHHGERLGGIWSELNKVKKPRDIIHRLTVPGTHPQKFVTSSKKMANLASQYHNSLQEKGIAPRRELDTDDEQRTPPHNAEYENAINEVLSTIPNAQKYNRQTFPELSKRITRDYVKTALQLGKNNSATGLDGCPYELWKKLNRMYIETQIADREGFDVLDLLTLVFQDIQQHGVEKDTEFTEGWMCPIFKKKDRTKIENYRPITLLNSDYKILTKALSLQLLEPIDKMIHRDQAGFIPGRSIFDHIRLTRIMIAYAEAMEVNGAIIALDQEKAYDKITHEYLWKTLEAFNLPPCFVNTVKALYQNAKTTVAINGELSAPYTVKRGVRQGDPLSCFLFNLGIEPLACMLRNSDKINGFAIPGSNERLTVNLFADDTVAYLREEDKYDDLQDILDKWCRASGAKFNKEKTEVIPIGTELHRNRIAESRRIHTTDTPLNDDIHIAKDGEAIRSLGSWVGNNITENTPWEPIIDKINKELNRTNLSQPSLRGKRLLSQIIIGGRTQFLTKAQGMPDHVKNTLTKLLRTFIWGENVAPRLALDSLHMKREQGGLELLNLKNRNEAIELVWLKEYLKAKPMRPTWAKLTDALINDLAPTNIRPEIRQNTFIQKWDVPTRGKRAKKLGKDTLRMLKTAQTHKLTFAPLNISQSLREQLPAWQHLGVEREPPQNPRSLCLVLTHNSKQVKDLLRITNKLDNVHPTGTHFPVFSCHCDECTEDRAKGCENPQRCAIEAQKRLNKITPKLDPKRRTFQDNLSLTQRRKVKNATAVKDGGDITFDPSVTAKADLAECYRILVNPEKVSNIPAERQPPARGITLPEEEIVMFTDGSCTNNGKLNARCGGGIWVDRDSNYNKPLRIPGPQQSNQVGEIAAVVKALEIAPTYAPLTLVTDSRYVIDGLTQHLTEWEDRGWIEIRNKDWFKRAAYLLRKRSAPTAFRWVKGHSGEEGNEESDALAKQGADKETPDEFSLEIPAHFDVQGAKLASISQAIAYRGLREANIPAPRRTTISNLEMIRAEIQQVSGELERDETIWESLRRQPVRPKIQDFLYKSIHGTHKIGRYWLNIENCNERCQCTTCNEDETLNHILTECPSTTRTTIWAAAQDLWPYEDALWPRISAGIILGCNLLEIKTRKQSASAQDNQTDEPTLDPGPTRLAKILISEAAYLIWTLRCDRVINNGNHSPSMVEAAWRTVINRRLTDDIITATKVLRRDDHTKLIVNTWQEALRKRHHDLSENWINLHPHL